ncbi:MAG: PQQ-binding-like beta-propeller repeat protein [Candidatus Hydrogenedens sp.]|nr:PQQ-binding-like beta-propeller repeat protein [Candidatus Hydrogenedens sp.]
MRKSFVWLLAIALLPMSAFAQHRVLLQGNDRLAIVGRDGSTVEWEMPWPMVHDLHYLDNGHILTVERFRKVVEIDPAAKEVVWDYDAYRKNGNRDRKIEIHAIQPLDDGNVMVAESGAGRIIEIDRDGKLLKEVPLKLDRPDTHRDTRLARKLANGNYIACHEGDGVVREYDGASGEVVWEYPVPLFDRERADGHGPEAFGNQAFGVLRLDNGNTLIATGNGHSIIEVTPAKEIIWEIHQNDLPGITLAWVTTLTMLPNGHLVFGNCHAGPGQPQLIEIDRETKAVVWTFEQWDAFGNDVSNAIPID